MIRVDPCSLPDVLLLEPRRFGDHRGTLTVTYNRDAWTAVGVDHEFIQDNQSLSRAAGTVRGLHFQVPPFAQAKLVQVVSGAVLDIAVDIRRGSPSFGAHVAVELSADNGRQLLVPVGFAHGFCTLTADTVVQYTVDAPYAPDADRGLLWNDPALGIAWPWTLVGADGSRATLSDRDRNHPTLTDLVSPFAA